jgi:signal peptidase I
VPDLPEQSRASREGRDPRRDGAEIAPEPRAAETALDAPATGTAPPRPRPANGSRDRLDDPLAPADPRRPTAGSLATEAEPEAEPDGDDGDDRRGRRARRRGWRSAVEWALVIGGALLVALVVRTFLVQAFWIPSASMEPTLHEGDRVLVNKLSYDLHDVRHGDVIVFERPDDPSDVPHPEDEIPDLIKRVVALPGDVIEARDGVVYLNDEPLDEPYLVPDTATNDLPRQEIPEGEVFVMGDNRTNSHDSRRFGPIDEGSIVGRAFLRIYPLDDIGGL